MIPSRPSEAGQVISKNLVSSFISSNAFFPFFLWPTFPGLNPSHWLLDSNNLSLTFSPAAAAFPTMSLVFVSPLFSMYCWYFCLYRLWPAFSEDLSLHFFVNISLFPSNKNPSESIRNEVALTGALKSGTNVPLSTAFQSNVWPALVHPVLMFFHLL